MLGAIDALCKVGGREDHSAGSVCLAAQQEKRERVEEQPGGSGWFKTRKKKLTFTLNSSCYLMCCMGLFYL